MQSISNPYRQVSKQEKRDQLILEHLDYVQQICSTLSRRFPEGVDLHNLQSAGVIGLIEAAQNFDPQRGVAFKTFAYTRIRGAIVDEVRRNSPLSQRIMRAISRIRAVADHMEPPYSLEELAAATGMTLDEVEEAMTAMRVASPQRWDESFSTATQDRHDEPESAMEHEERKRLMADAIEQLPEKQRLVLTLYYLEELRLKEIGTVLNLSESRVSRILAKAELRLRQICNPQSAD